MKLNQGHPPQDTLDQAIDEMSAGLRDRAQVEAEMLEAAGRLIEVLRAAATAARELRLRVEALVDQVGGAR